MSSLTDGNRVFVEYVVHCHVAHQAHLPGDARCALCRAAQQWLAGTPLTPKGLIDAAEASITAGFLPARAARRQEEYVLQQTGPTGQWREDADAHGHPAA
jgi:hypothetical protein